MNEAAVSKPEPACPEVPRALQGLWRRTLLSSPAGAASPGQYDTTTQVYWLQTPLWHGDIRVPADRPDFGDAQALADCSEAQLRWLLSQQGFAGLTTLERDICRWHRRIDHAASLEQDVGRLAFDADGLDEWGLEADYYERWVPVDGADGPAAALGNAATRSVFLRSGHWAMQLRARTLDAHATRAVRAAAAAGEPVERAGLEAAADFEISLAEWGESGWHVALSTLPWREGQTLCADPQHWAEPGALPLPSDRMLTE